MPVRAAVGRLAEIIGALPAIWVEGQVSRLRVRSGMAYVTLHDVEVEAVLTVIVPTSILNAVSPAVAEGSRIVVRGKPEIWVRRGELALRAVDVRAVGVGELLERLEQLKRTLAAEGLFAPERKKALPFAPRVVGLICGRASAAEKDVIENARRRWPAVTFAVKEVAVQGTSAVTQVKRALSELDQDSIVEVIVITRGGGSFEDLLAFSDESLLRAVADATTPVVSAIGHEEDTPLLDLVADVRASTPTDAARRIVPDVVSERANLQSARSRMRRVVRDRVGQQAAFIGSLRQRPVLADRSAPIRWRRDEVGRLRLVARSTTMHRVQRQLTQMAALNASLRALSPAATLDRGFAIVRMPNGDVVRSALDAPAGTQVSILVAEGEFGATSTGPHSTPKVNP